MIRYVCSLMWLVVAVLSIFPAMMSPMLFDAPGSTSDLWVLAFAWSILCLPGNSLLAVYALIVAGKPMPDWAVLFVQLPGINLVVIIFLGIMWN